MIRGLEINVRAAERSDARFICDLLNEPSVGEGWGTSGVPVSIHRVEADLESWIETERSTQRPAALVIETLEQVPVGIVLVDVSPRPNQSMATLSIAIAAERQGTGIGRDALTALIDALINEWGIHRIQMRCETGNERAIALYRSLGFHLDATRRRATFTGGEYRDQHVFSLLATDQRGEPA